VLLYQIVLRRGETPDNKRQTTDKKPNS